jgi:ACT domain-containing protein
MTETIETASHMSLSDFEIGKIAEIVAGQSGTKLDAKTLRQVIDRVVDQMNDQRGNPEIKGVTCDVSRTVLSGPSLGGPPFTVGTKEPTINGGPPKPQKVTSLAPPDEVMAAAKGGLYEQIEKTDKTRVIIATFGKDRPGVVSALTAILSEHNCSIEDISQTLLQDFFSMIMIVNIAGCPIDFSGLRDRLQQTETQLGMKVYVMHEDIFKYMHRI